MNTRHFAGVLCFCVGLLGAAQCYAAQPTKPIVYDNVVVLSIGIDQYEHRGIPPAQFAESDAKEVGSVLEDRFGFSPVYLLGKNATKAAILDKLDGCARKAGSDGVLIVFFAGHGQVINLPERNRAGFLLPYDADLDLTDSRDTDAWYSQALDMSRLTKNLSDLDVKHVVLLADACCSGFLTKRGSVSGRLDLQRLLDNPSHMVLAATTESQPAGALPNEKHGIFSASLLRVLRDTNSPLSLTDVFVKVRADAAHDSQGTMMPTISHFGNKDDGGGEFVFLPTTLDSRAVEREVANARRGAEPPQILRGMLQRAAERANLRSTLKDVIDAFNALDYRYAEDAAEKSRIWESRVARLQDNASCGDIMAMIALHYCCSKGLGCKKDDAAAFHWAELAYDTGHPGGKHVYGRCLEYQIGTPINEPAGIKLIREAAAGSEPFPISLLQSGADYCNSRDYKAARRMFETASDAGVDMADMYLADLDLGINPTGGLISGMAPDIRGAISVLQRASRDGNPNAQLLLAKAYSLARTPAALADSRQWLERAAKQGLASAQSALARELDGGVNWPLSVDLPLRLGFARDPNRALQYARLAAKQEDPVAFVILACVYESKHQYEQASKYCDLAVEKNYPAAIVLKSVWYGTNTVYPIDRKEQIRWALRVANSDDASAMLWLGALYADGDKNLPLKGKDYLNGVPVYKHYALHYYTQAAARGSASAREQLQDFVKKPQERFTDTEWSFFERDFPQSAETFKRLTGYRP